MASKIPNSAMNLKQFLVRLEVLSLYRDIFRTIRQVSDAKTRQELRDWARTDFRNNMHVTDSLTIKTLLNNGKKSLQDLQNSLALSSSKDEKQEKELNN